MKPRNFSIQWLVALSFLASALAAPSVVRAGDDSEYTKMAGYVDFGSIAGLVGREAKVEVHLKDPMINLISKFVRDEDPELFDVLSRLKLVHVRVYDVDNATAKSLSAASSETAKALDKKGWERIVRVREDNEHVDVYIRASANYEWIEGLAVMALSEDDEAVFVNIVGQIRPEDVGKLGDHFDIDALHGFGHGEVDKSAHKSTDAKSKKKKP